MLSVFNYGRRSGCLLLGKGLLRSRSVVDLNLSILRAKWLKQ